jgi:hypothetical protein
MELMISCEAELRRNFFCLLSCIYSKIHSAALFPLLFVEISIYQSNQEVKLRMWSMRETGGKTFHFRAGDPDD